MQSKTYLGSYYSSSVGHWTPGASGANEVLTRIKSNIIISLSPRSRLAAGR